MLKLITDDSVSLDTSDATKHKHGSNSFKPPNMIHRLSAFLPYLLSHHPLCSEFDTDVLIIGRIKLCTGCFISYPIAAGLILLKKLAGFPDVEWYVFFTAGAMLGILNLLSTAGYTNTRTTKVFIKVALGIGLGWTFLGIIYAPLTTLLKAAVFIFATLAIFGLSLMRYFSIRRVCRRCRWKGDYKVCEGMKPSLCNF
ncbi:MAG: hypothetical protein QW728_02130 [Thermoplasmata archaeon]